MSERFSFEEKICVLRHGFERAFIYFLYAFYVLF